MTNLRIGHGYDVHRLTQGRRLILGGVDIPWENGIAGPTPTPTVLVHAVMDALTGAARLGVHREAVSRHGPPAMPASPA